MPIGPRPYGRGAYGVGPYSRWGAVVYELGAAAGIAFAAHAAPARIMPLQAASGIVFDARSHGGERIISPGRAITGIVFAADASLAWSWDGWAPCAPGGWQAPAGCAAGAWQTPVGCGVGAWTVTRLT